MQEILFRLREDVHGHNVAKRGSNEWDACGRVVRASLRSATFALSAGGTPAVPVELGALDNHDGFYGVEEDKGQCIILSIAIIQCHVVIGYFHYMSLVDATGHTSDSHKLALVAAK